MLSFSRCRPFAGVVAGAAIAGCAGNGLGLDANGQPIGSGGAPPPLTADFQSIQLNVFTPICTKCHIGAGAPQGLQLDAAHSYSLLVGVPSAEAPGVLRVKPGAPDASYIVLKLQGSSGIAGGRMPLGGPYLPQSTIDVIRQWITNGAPQAAAAEATAAVKSAGAGASARAPESTHGFAVTAASPLNDSVVTDPVATIVVAFNREVDASLVNYTTVRLERAQPRQENSSADSMAISVAPVEPTAAPGPFEIQLPVSVALARGNPSALVITPAAVLRAGTYRVTLRGTGGGALADVNAQTLGTDYSLVFTVEVSP